MVKKIYFWVLPVLSAFLFALSMNLFIVPYKIYSGGVLGICQVLRTFFGEITGINTDVSGIFYYALNIPLLFLAYKSIGKSFFIKTLVTVSMISAFLSLIPIMENPIFEDDIFISIVVGAILVGVSIGLSLQAGASTGGMDILALYMLKKGRIKGVGSLYLLLNAVLFFVYSVLFDIKIALYSLIFEVISALATDRTHSKNISVEAIVISKDNEKMQNALLKNLGRGVTFWEGKGAYTNENKRILFVILSKYEVPVLEKTVRAEDENAFTVICENVFVKGYFEKKF